MTVRLPASLSPRSMPAQPRTVPAPWRLDSPPFVCHPVPPRDTADAASGTPGPGERVRHGGRRRGSVRNRIEWRRADSANDSDTGLDGAATAPWPREHELAPAADRGRSAQMSSDGCSWVFTGTPPERPSERPQHSPKGGWGRRPARAPPHRGECPNPPLVGAGAGKRPRESHSLANCRRSPQLLPDEVRPRLRDSGQVLFFSEKHLDRLIVRSA